MNNFEVKDNGDRKTFDSGMVRDTAQNKPRFDLVIPEHVPFEQQLLTRIAMLYMRGAEKYSETIIDVDTSYLVQFIQEELLCQTVESTRIDQYMRRDTAGLAMKSDFVPVILNSRNAKDGTEGLGVTEILNGLSSCNNCETQTPNVSSEIDKQNGSECYDREGSLRKQTHYFWNTKVINAESVKNLFDPAQSILITTIKTASREDTYVMVATEGWVCWATLFRALSGRYDIFKNLRLQSSSTSGLQLVTLNPRNWEQATGPEELTRFKASAFRHFMQWFCGETEEDHAAMTFFNIQGVELVKHKMERLTASKLEELKRKVMAASVPLGTIQ